ncbi:ficolin-1-A-like [Ciona intestinalis]
MNTTPVIVEVSARPTNPSLPHTFKVTVTNILRHSVIVELERTDQKSGWDEISITVDWESSDNYPILNNECKEGYEAGNNKSGIYRIKKNGTFIEVYCDMTTDGGGWTVFQRRINGEQDFYLKWDEYRRGFGDKNKEFWLGLDNLHLFTRSGSFELRIELKNCQNQAFYAKYGMFKILDLSTKFRLQVGDFLGSNGLQDSLTAMHHNMIFSTYDNNPKINTTSISCAEAWHGAWWYRGCHLVNLNGEYLPCVDTARSMTWAGNGTFIGFRFSEMKFRSL